MSFLNKRLDLLGYTDDVHGGVISFRSLRIHQRGARKRNTETRCQQL